MSKFTKGDWHIDHLTGEVRANGERIAKVYGATTFNKSYIAAECHANARLVVNAPKMLHALKKAQIALETNPFSAVLAEEIEGLIDDVEEAEHE